MDIAKDFLKEVFIQSFITVGFQIQRHTEYKGKHIVQNICRNNV